MTRSEMIDEAVHESSAYLRLALIDIRQQNEFGRKRLARFRENFRRIAEREGYRVVA